METRPDDGPDDGHRCLLDRVDALLPVLEAEAAESERLRRPTDAAIAALEASGVFELLVPRCHGGLELDLDAFRDVGLRLGRADASLAWVADFYIEHNWLLARFDPEFQDELFAERSHVLAPAVVSPQGVARPVPGGHRVSGRWPWASGSAHGDWVLVTAIAGEGEGADLRWFALPRADATVEDTWHVSGMCATASGDIVVDDVTVPESRSLSLTAFDTEPVHDAAVYRSPMIPVLSMAACMPGLAQARVTVERFAERCRERHLAFTGERQADVALAQARLARAEIEVHQAELLFDEVVAGIMAHRGGASVEVRSAWAFAFAWITDRARAVVRSLVEASGGSVHFTDQPMQRTLRDLHVLSGHILFDLDRALVNRGRIMLGLDPSSPVL